MHTSIVTIANKYRNRLWKSWRYYLLADDEFHLAVTIGEDVVHLIVCFPSQHFTIQLQHLVAWEEEEAEKEEQSLKLALRQPRVWSVGDFSASAISTLTVSSPNRQGTVDVLIIAELGSM